ncbi:hypothetical protein Rsub_06693 [Raphidocelis subcapitata]|uniref:Uncharacterized protein n=1 Tax=Raphidocelis subcapitata TaxID=307507 RepID=A0A2V0P3Z7_9CHLO|nr:hypothetical protein Rsub_06693 [Raphidocelis subcapitata]|eukprot:GBF94578.1 hypothetical protein Rsub_06693 [Raphidocelis subcapitata]
MPPAPAEASVDVEAAVAELHGRLEALKAMKAELLKQTAAALRCCAEEQAPGQQRGAARKGRERAAPQQGGAGARETETDGEAAAEDGPAAANLQQWEPPSDAEFGRLWVAWRAAQQPSRPDAQQQQEPPPPAEPLLDARALAAYKQAAAATAQSRQLPASALAAHGVAMRSHAHAMRGEEEYELLDAALNNANPCWAAAGSAQPAGAAQQLLQQRLSAALLACRREGAVAVGRPALLPLPFEEDGGGDGGGDGDDEMAEAEDLQLPSYLRAAGVGRYTPAAAAMAAHAEPVGRAVGAPAPGPPSPPGSNAAAASVAAAAASISAWHALGERLGVEGTSAAGGAQGESAADTCAAPSAVALRELLGCGGGDDDGGWLLDLAEEEEIAAPAAVHAAAKVCAVGGNSGAAGVGAISGAGCTDDDDDGSASSGGEDEGGELYACLAGGVRRKSRVQAAAGSSVLPPAQPPCGAAQPLPLEVVEATAPQGPFSPDCNAGATGPFDQAVPDTPPAHATPVAALVPASEGAPAPGPAPAPVPPAAAAPVRRPQLQPRRAQRYQALAAAGPAAAEAAMVAVGTAEGLNQGGQGQGVLQAAGRVGSAAAGEEEAIGGGSGSGPGSQGRTGAPPPTRPLPQRQQPLPLLGGGRPAGAVVPQLAARRRGAPAGPALHRPGATGGAAASGQCAPPRVPVAEDEEAISGSESAGDGSGGGERVLRAVLQPASQRREQAADAGAPLPSSDADGRGFDDCCGREDGGGVGSGDGRGRGGGGGQGNADASGDEFEAAPPPRRRGRGGAPAPASAPQQPASAAAAEAARTFAPDFFEASLSRVRHAAALAATSKPAWKPCARAEAVLRPSHQLPCQPLPQMFPPGSGPLRLVSQLLGAAAPAFVSEVQQQHLAATGSGRPGGPQHGHPAAPWQQQAGGLRQQPPAPWQHQPAAWQPQQPTAWQHQRQPMGAGWQQQQHQAAGWQQQQQQQHQHQQQPMPGMGEPEGDDLCDVDWEALDAIEQAYAERGTDGLRPAQQPPAAAQLPQQHAPAQARAWPSAPVSVGELLRGSGGGGTHRVPLARPAGLPAPPPALQQHARPPAGAGWEAAVWDGGCWEDGGGSPGRDAGGAGGGTPAVDGGCAGSQGEGSLDSGLYSTLLLDCDDDGKSALFGAHAGASSAGRKPAGSGGRRNQRQQPPSPGAGAQQPQSPGGDRGGAEGGASRMDLDFGPCDGDGTIAIGGSGGGSLGLLPPRHMPAAVRPAAPAAGRQAAGDEGAAATAAAAALLRQLEAWAEGARAPEAASSPTNGGRRRRADGKGGPVALGGVGLFAGQEWEGLASLAVTSLEDEEEQDGGGGSAGEAHDGQAPPSPRLRAPAKRAASPTAGGGGLPAAKLPRAGGACCDGDSGGIGPLDKRLAAALLQLGEIGCDLLLEDAADDDLARSMEVEGAEGGGACRGADGTDLQQHGAQPGASAGVRPGTEDGSAAAAEAASDAPKAARARREALARRFIEQALREGARRGRGGGLSELRTLIEALSRRLGGAARDAGAGGGTAGRAAGGGGAARRVALRELLAAAARGGGGDAAGAAAAQGAVGAAGAPAAPAVAAPPPPQRVFVALLHLATQSNQAAAAAAATGGAAAAAGQLGPIALAVAGGGGGTAADGQGSVEVVVLS